MRFDGGDDGGTGTGIGTDVGLLAATTTTAMPTSSTAIGEHSLALEHSDTIDNHNNSKNNHNHNNYNSSNNNHSNNNSNNNDSNSDSDVERMRDRARARASPGSRDETEWIIRVGWVGQTPTHPRIIPFTLLSHTLLI